jgi:hypothetical protein
MKLLLEETVILYSVGKVFWAKFRLAVIVLKVSVSIIILANPNKMTISIPIEITPPVTVRYSDYF